jgi:hypothetical protein
MGFGICQEKTKNNIPALSLTMPVCRALAKLNVSPVRNAFAPPANGNPPQFIIWL